ncbi:hypothetical protein NQZ68_033186 [Dissostichus eleginoides]|nr:hypothetical protein NQZ68_033186 [Dissostichus eleginoides]
MLNLPDNLLHGGSGRRKLSIIPTDSEGYSTRLLKTASSNGKNRSNFLPNHYPMTQQRDAAVGQGVNRHVLSMAMQKLKTGFSCAALTSLFEGEMEHRAPSAAAVLRESNLFEMSASPKVLRDLLKVWVGWELLTTNLEVEVVTSKYPLALTCFLKLKLPSHYQTYEKFQQDLMTALSSISSGFGH